MNPPDPSADVRLQSWKAIASFFDRDERTVRRWEKTHGLPVYRVHGGKSAGVFAYRHELEAWLHSGGEGAPSSAAGEALEAPQPTEAPALSAIDSITPHAEQGWRALLSTAQSRRIWILGAGAALVAIAASSALPGLRSRHGDTQHAPPIAAVDPATRMAPSSHVPASDELYLKGRFYWHQRTPESLRKAMDLFSRAVRLDNNNARAYAGLADCYNFSTQYFRTLPTESYPKAIEFAQRAIEIDPQLAEGHRALAFATLYYKWDEKTALAEFERAIALNPSDPDARQWYANALFGLGRFDDALAKIDEALRLDPTSVSIRANHGLIMASTTRRDEGIAELRELTRANATSLQSRQYLARIFLDREMYPELIEQLQEIARISGRAGDAEIAEAVRRGWSEHGRTGALQAQFDADQRRFNQGEAVAPELARIALLLGRRQDAVKYMRFCVDQRDFYVVSLLRSDFVHRIGDEPAIEDLRRQAFGVRIVASNSPAPLVAN